MDKDGEGTIIGDIEGLENYFEDILGTSISIVKEKHHRGIPMIPVSTIVENGRYIFFTVNEERYFVFIM